MKRTSKMQSNRSADSLKSDQMKMTTSKMEIGRDSNTVKRPITKTKTDNSDEDENDVSVNPHKNSDGEDSDVEDSDVEDSEEEVSDDEDSDSDSFESSEYGLDMGERLFRPRRVHQCCNKCFPLDIFTGRSRLDASVSLAFVIPSMKVERAWCLFAFPSIITAELIAIQKALEYAEGLDVHLIRIFSDSKSALSAITLQLAFSPVGWIRHKLDQFTRAGVEVELIWIPSHKSVPGNKRVQKLASACFYDPHTPFLPQPKYFVNNQ